MRTYPGFGAVASRGRRQRQRGFGRYRSMPSSVIRSYRYDPARRELNVVFQSQRRYTYSEVPAETYAAMKGAFSKGEFFNRHIRDKFSFRRDDDASPRPRSPADTP